MNTTNLIDQILADKFGKTLDTMKVEFLDGKEFKMLIIMGNDNRGRITRDVIQNGYCRIQKQNDILDFMKNKHIIYQEKLNKVSIQDPKKSPFKEDRLKNADTWYSALSHNYFVWWK